MRKYNVLDTEALLSIDDVKKQFRFRPWSIESKRKMGVSCAVGHSFDTPGGEVEKIIFTDVPNLDINYKSIKDLYQFLMDIQENDKILVGHNIVDYDLEAMWGQFETLGIIGPINVIPGDYAEDDRSSTPEIYARSSHIADTRNGFTIWPKLEALGQETLGRGKTGSGALMPEMWQAGKYKEVIEYCDNDVEITRLVYEFYLKNGYVVYRDQEVDPCWIT